MNFAEKHCNALDPKQAGQGGGYWEYDAHTCCLSEIRNLQIQALGKGY